MFAKSFEVTDFTLFKTQLLIWASRFSSCAFLDNHNYASRLSQHECLVAAGARASVSASAGNALERLQLFIAAHPGEWIFGHLGYDLGQEIEFGQASTLINPVGFHDLHFFVPETVVQLTATSIHIESNTKDPVVLFQEIVACNPVANEIVTTNDPAPCISKEEYFEKIERLKHHIHRGDCYEINFCQEFATTGVQINPQQVFSQLNDSAPNPFACYYRVDQSHLICASPERFLMRKGERLYSQPIKGTAPRAMDDSKADALQREKLSRDQKERSENVMIVDLVRNDLSRICEEGSVQVEELFGIYTFPHVHQMISTITGLVRPGLSFSDLIKATFPMGSMTGAPKRRVMELIAQYECGSRGVFSGSVGYISPSGDFDFNVVIRSLQYNQLSGYLSYWVGGGITWYSQPEKEYEECLTKAQAIKKVLQSATL